MPASYHCRRGLAIEARLIQRFAALDFLAGFNLAGAESLKQFCGAAFAWADSVNFEDWLLLRQRSSGEKNQ